MRTLWFRLLWLVCFWISPLPEATAKIFTCAELVASGSPPKYDYIVVGAGAGGAPLAVRLVQAGYRVLIVEAGGPDQPIESQVPAFHAVASESMPIAYDYGVTHFDDPAQATRDSKYDPKLGGVLYPRGQGIGGSPLVNAGITVLPHKDTFNRIGQMFGGDPNWSDERMWRIWNQKIENCQHRPFLRAIHRTGQWLHWGALQNWGGHGFDGWLKVSRPRPSVIANILFHDAQLRKILLTAERENRPGIGGAWQYLQRLASGADPNDRRSVNRNEAGIVITPLAVNERGKRNGIRDLVLKTEREFPDRLHIATNAIASKIIFDESKRATGLEIIIQRAGLGAEDEVAGEVQGLGTILVGKEIIVSAGTFESPALLMRSGVGPAADLARIGINPLVVNDQVGRNLHDRYEIGIVSDLRDPIASLQGATFSANPNDPIFRQWQRNGGGLYGTNGSLIAFTAPSHPSLVEPNLYIFGLPAGFRGYEQNYSTSITANPRAFTWAVLVAKTQNRAGFVTLTSSDPKVQPTIDFQYFQEGAAADEQALREGVRIVRDLNRKMPPGLFSNELSPGRHIQTDADITDWARREAWGHHAVGTMALGTVTDRRFRLMGTSNVRIVDASVFPDIPGYFVATSVYIASELAAELVLEDANEIVGY